MKNEIVNYINHIVFVVDASGSMEPIKAETVEVFDAQIKRLARRSAELDQETRVTVYLFNNHVKCIIFDKDVLRVPSLKAHYDPNHGTALIDGTHQAISDLKETHQKYGDHAFLIYVLTDGEENSSLVDASVLKAEIADFDDNWTIAALVPNINGVHEAKKAGFPAQNILTWDATPEGIAEVGKKMDAANEMFMQNRAKGIRGSTALFVVDTSNLSTKEVKKKLTALKPSTYKILSVSCDAAIRPFVEVRLGTFVKGLAYYQLTKPETVQSYKQVIIRDKQTKSLYAGDDARELLKLPPHELRLKPEQLSKFDIFVQSTSVNRKLLAGTSLVVLHSP